MANKKANLSMPIIDCIIPTHNNEKYLEECLESLLSQTYGDFQIIICDAASEDNTLNIIEKFQKKGLSIEIIQGQSDQGLAHSLNILFKHCRSKYIAVQLPDDTSHKKRFETQLHRMKNSSLVALGCAVDWIGSNEEHPVSIAYINPKDVLFSQLDLSNMRGVHFQTLLYERKALGKSFKYDEKLASCFEVQTHVNLQYAYPLCIANVDEKLYEGRLFKGCFYEKAFEAEKSIDRKELYGKFSPQLFYIKDRYLDNILVTPAYRPY